MTWHVVNELVKHKNHDSSVSLKLKTSAGDTVSEDLKVIDEKFNNFFVNIVKEVSSNQTCKSDVSTKITFEKPPSTSNSIFFVTSTDIKVCGLINQLKSYKARKAIYIEFRFINWPIRLSLTF